MMRSLRIVSIALVSLAAIALVNTAWAQPGPGGPRGPGFGRMPRMSLNMMYGMLLNSKTVQKDLDLVDDQKTKIKEINDKADAARGELFSGMRDLSQEERQARFAKMPEIAEKTAKEIEGVLLPAQLTRLKGIAVQRMGVMALGDKGIQKDLKLTDEQASKIKAIGEEMMKKWTEKMPNRWDPNATPEERRKAGEEMRKVGEELRAEGEKKAMEVLTAEQKTAFEKLKGKELKIPDSDLPGPGFGGRGGRHGNGGGNPPPVN